jgi:hypothetical protein
MIFTFCSDKRDGRGEAPFYRYDKCRDQSCGSTQNLGDEQPFIGARTQTG